MNGKGQQVWRFHFTVGKTMVMDRVNLFPNDYFERALFNAVCFGSPNMALGFLFIGTLHRTIGDKFFCFVGV